MKTKTKHFFKTAITIPILLLMMLLSFSVHSQTHVYNETTASGIFTDPDGALVANPLSDAFNSSANCARAATGGFGKIQIFPTYTPGATDRLYFSVYNPNGASFGQIKFEYTGAPGVWEDGGDVYYGSASTTGWVEYSIGLAPNEGNTINKIILMPSGSSSVAVYVDNIYFHTTSLYPTSGATHFFKDVVENGSIFHSGAGIFNNPLPADPINSTVKCLRTNGTGAWRETQIFNVRYVVKTADKLFISFYNPNNATQWQLRFLFRDGDYLGPADIAHVSGASSGWSEVSVDLTPYIGKEIEKISLFAAHSELKQVYSDNIYIGSASVTPQQPVVYNETISSGMWFQGTNGAQVSNPVSDVVNSSANVARSATDGGWQQIQYFPNYTVAAGNKLYFSVHNPNGASFGQVQFEYTTGGGWHSGGDVTYVSGSTTGWREYSIDLTGHVGNTINKIILMPAGDSSAAVYVDNVYFGSVSTTPAPQTPLVYNETVSSGMWFQGTNGAQVSNPVSDVVNSSANVARSATDGGWQQIQYFPNYTVAAGNKLYFSVHNPNGASFGQVQFEYTTGGGWHSGGDVTYVSGSTTGWREYSIDLTGHVGNTINKIILMPAGDSSAAVYVDNVYFGSVSTTPAPQTPLVYNETVSSGMWFQGTNGAQVSNPVLDAVNSSANVAKSATDGGWQQIQYFPNYTVAAGNKLYFSVHNPNGASFGQVQFEYTTGGGWHSGGDVTYVSGSTTGWREYSIDLTGHVGNTINKIILMPAGDSSAAVYVDNVYFGSVSTTPAPQTPLVYNETISSGMWFQGTNGAQVSNPVLDAVNSSANVAKSATDGGWQQIQYFPNYTVVTGNKLYFSVYNPNNAGPAQVQFEYTTGGGWQWGDNVTYVSGSLTGWREYSIDLSSHVGNTINKIILMPAGDSSSAVYVDNVYFGSASILTETNTPIVANTGICKGTVGATPSATPFTGYTLVWYKDGTTTTALPTAPVITATKTYYVAQRLGAGPISPRVPVTTTVNLLPTTPSPVVLTEGATVIKKVGNFIGTSTALTLTATAAGTVPTDHYNWTLPTDVAQVSGGNTGVITVNFAAVAPGITALDFFVSSVSAEGCVSKTAKKLTVTRALPAKPKALTLTDALLPEVLKITKLGAYTGALKTRTLTLTATPETKAGSQASSYKWVLPSTVGIVGGSATFVSTDLGFSTYTSESNIISINLAGVTTETTFLFQVYGVNGNGESALSKDLTCTSAAPKTPAIVASLPTFNTCSTRTYTTTDQLGATFNWTVPAGASIVGASTGNVIVVDFSSVTTAASYAVTCSASNGLTSVVKSLTIKRAATCAKIAPEEVVAEDNFSAIAYPNPSSDEFTIESSRKGANVKVYDMVGRLIENRQATATSVQVGRNYATGIYNVIVSQGGRAKTLKVIKK